MKRLKWICLALILMVLAVDSTGQNKSPVLVGAIRWDAWYKVDNGIANNHVPKIVEANLSFKQFHFRVPFFAKLQKDSIFPCLTYLCMERI